MIVFLFLLLALTSAPLYAQQPTDAVGIVNGDTIRLDEFSRDIGRRTEFTMSSGSVNPSEIVELSWVNMVYIRLIEQEAKKRGVVVSAATVDSTLLYQTPDYIKRGIRNSKGAFDPQLLRGMVLNPDSLVLANMKGAGKEEIAEQRAELIESVNELRERIRFSILETTLREHVAKTFVVDSSLLRKAFFAAAVRCTVDLVRIPCLGRVPQPAEREVRAYYDSHPSEFSTTVPLRAMKVLTWPLTPAPVDSSLALQETKRFVQLLSRTTAPLQRDSLLTNVGSNARSAKVVLHPDTARLKDFYNICVKAKAGSVIGPFAHESGLYAILVDSIKTENKKKIYVTRMALFGIEPSQETVDSIIRVVQNAGNKLANGATLAEVATMSGALLDSTGLLSNSQSFYESYRFVDEMFATQPGKYTNIVDVPGHGLCVGYVTDTLAPGLIPYMYAKQSASAIVERTNACRERQPLARRAFAMCTRTPEGEFVVTEQIQNSEIIRNASVEASGIIGSRLIDIKTADVILEKENPGIFGPFLGDTGWMIVNIQTIVRPNPLEFPLYLNLHGSDLVAEQQEQHWQKFLSSLQNSASIQDYRALYFQY